MLQTFFVFFPEASAAADAIYQRTQVDYFFVIGTSIEITTRSFPSELFFIRP
jgi:hypothetical protein